MDVIRGGKEKTWILHTFHDNIKNVSHYHYIAVYHIVACGTGGINQSGTYTVCLYVSKQNSFQWTYRWDDLLFTIKFYPMQTITSLFSKVFFLLFLCLNDESHCAINVWIWTIKTMWSFILLMTLIWLNLISFFLLLSLQFFLPPVEPLNACMQSENILSSLLPDINMRH